MKKFLAGILALMLVLSTALVSVAAEPADAEAQAPWYTGSVKDWTFANTTVTDNTLFTSALFDNYAIGSANYHTIFSSADGAPTLAEMAAWLKSGTGQMRFWVKLPWREGTPELSYLFDFSYYVKIEETGSSGYPETHATVNIAADGLWHEIRINASDFHNPAAFDTWAADERSEIISFYALRVRAVNASAEIAAKEGFYCSSSVEYFSEAITAEINDGNREVKVFMIDSPNNDSVAGLSFGTAKIADNKFYRTAQQITRTDAQTSVSGKKFSPYKADPTPTAVDGVEVTENELAGWFNNRGDMRTYVKNDSDSETTLKIGIKGSVLHPDYSGTQYPAMTKTVTLPANSGWVELRFSYGETGFAPDAKKTEQFTQASTIYNIWLYIETTTDPFLANEGDSLYVTPLEVYDRNIVGGVTTSFEREYKALTTLNKDTSWKIDGQGYIDRVSTTTDELPFFGNMITYTATDLFDINSYNEKQLGYTYQDNVSYSDFAEWACYNPDAEMRFWIKTEKAITFVFELLESGSGTNKAIQATVSVEGAPDWQEIRLKRSDFTVSTAFDDVFASGAVEAGGISLFLRDFTEGVEAGDVISLSRCVEFYSHEVYDKGDLNRDGAVDVLDFIRVKKYIANAETAFINGDINGDGKLAADDLAYLRRWLLTGAWK